jgi:Homeodomain-like domain
MASDERITELVRDLAARHGVSERTVWRWRKDRANGSEVEVDFPYPHEQCEACARWLPEHRTIRRRFCDVSCRVWSHRNPPDKRTVGIPAQPNLSS